MGVLESQKQTITAPDGTKQVSNTVRTGSLMGSENPSIIKTMTSNLELIRDLQRNLAGWVPVMDENAQGGMRWEQIGKPMMNQKGRAWFIPQIQSLTSRTFILSNFSDIEVREKVRAECISASIHLAKHLKEYEIDWNDCTTIISIYSRLAYASYRRPVGDKERDHIYGSLDENSTNTPNQKKTIGGITLPF